MTTIMKKAAALALSVAFGTALSGVFSEANAAEKKTAKQTASQKTERKNGEAKAKAEELYREGYALAFGMNGRKVDGARGMELLKEAAEAGALDAQAVLALLYAEGCEGAEADLAEAFESAVEPAKAGNVIALCVKLLCYMKGEPVLQDSERVAELKKEIARRAADLDPLENPVGAVNAAAITGDWDACAAVLETKCAAATLLYALELQRQGKDGDDAIPLFRQAAEQEEPRALYCMGCLYFNGSGVPKDLKKSFEYFEKAAVKKNLPAFTSLGTAYEQGLGVEKNPREAIRWYERAAAQNEPFATTKIALVKLSEGDYRSAIELLRRAAKAGDAQAMMLLAARYLKGEGTEQSLGAAQTWFKRAADKGVEPAKEMYRELRAMRNSNR